MQYAVLALAIILFIVSLPVVIELSLFVFANLFLRFSVNSRPKADPRVAIRKIGILVPAHNEEKHIGRCVASLLATAPSPYAFEVIVIADNCQDRTADLASEAGARTLVRFNDQIKGKGAALHWAVEQLAAEDHDAYIIVDADTIVLPNFIQVMGDHFASGKEAIQCIYLALNVEASPKIRLMNLALLSMNVLRPLGREIFGFSVGIMGNGFGLTKKLLAAVPYSANSITEDLEYHLKLIENGRKVRFVPNTRVLADFPVSKEGAETQRARWEGGRFMLQRSFFGKMLGRILRGKLSLVEPFLELMSMPLSYEVLMLIALIALPWQPFFFYGIAGIGLIALQTLLAVLIHGNKNDFKALFEIPAYLFWKLVRLPNIILTSRKNASWVRTKRD